MTWWGWTLFAWAVAPWFFAGFALGWIVAADWRRARSEERDMFVDLHQEVARILRGRPS